MRAKPFLVMALVTGSTLVGTTVQTRAQVTPQKVAPTVVAGKIDGAPTKSQVLAVLSSGASAYAKIKPDGTFSVKLPKVKGGPPKVSLHIVDSDHSYAGPISFGKKVGTPAVTKWYSSIIAKVKDTTQLPTITFSLGTHFGSVMLVRASAGIAATNALKGASATGKPKGAGRLGLAPNRKASPNFVDRRIRRAAIDGGGGESETLPGGDLDSDGLPNSLDIDDDADGYADPVDPSTSSSSDNTPTSKYDAFSSLGSSIGTGPSRITSPNNYNILRTGFTDDELRAEISQLISANFTMSVRAVAPFFSNTPGVYIKAAWVDCEGLVWCMNADDTENSVDAPRLVPVGDGYIGQIWKFANTKTPGTECNLYAMDDCNEVVWSDFNMKGFLRDGRDNDGFNRSGVSQGIIDEVGVQPDNAQGFGLYDPAILNGYPASGSTNWEMNKAGFDLNANVQPRGNAQFLDHLKAGDVFTINALLSDGTTTSIAMTVAPYFVTSPTITNFIPSGQAEIPVDYTPGNDPICAARIGNADCRLGSEGNPFNISASNPTLEFSFWRPQRLRIPLVDDSIPGAEPLVDMGRLDYRVSVYVDGGSWYDCPNNAVTFTDSDTSTWLLLPKPDNPMSNDHEYMTDPTSDSQASISRTVTVTVDFDSCGDLPITAGATKISVRLEADSQPTFGGQRGSTTQNFYFRFN